MEARKECMYKNILVAVDLHPSYDELTLAKAVHLANENNARLHVIHVVEGIHTYGAGQGYQLIVEVENELEKEADKALSYLCQKYNILREQQIIARGSPKMAVLDNAKRLNVDLIIVGSHGLHGINVIFGSTADGITHNAPCDVLAICVKSST